VVEAVSVLTWFLHVEEVTLGLLMLQDRGDQVFKDGPTVCHLEIQLIDKLIWFLSAESDYFVLFIRICINSLREGEPHPVDAAKN